MKSGSFTRSRMPCILVTGDVSCHLKVYLEARVERAERAHHLDKGGLAHMPVQ